MTGVFPFTHTHTVYCFVGSYSLETHPKKKHKSNYWSNIWSNWLAFVCI